MAQFLLDALRSIRVHDVVGMGFAGVAAYGFVTGHVSEANLATVSALAGAYLGLRANGYTRNKLDGGSS